MEYVTLTDCRRLLFPYIRSRMIEAESAPDYESEQHGLDRLESILSLMERDDYGDVMAKAAYLFCSIIDGHPFSNGNKRLSVTILLFFLLRNGLVIYAPNMEVMREQLQRIFPNVAWEEVRTFRYPHEYFFYHLALIIADRKQKGQLTFRQEQAAVQQLLSVVAAESQNI